MYQRKNGTWCDTLPQGKGKPPKFFYGKTKAEVKQKMADWSAEKEAGITVAEAVDNWFNERKTEFSDNTQLTYKVPMQRVKDAIGDVHIKQLQPAQIKEMIASLQRKGFKGSTLRLPYVVLNSSIEHEMSKPDSDIKFNPCHNVNLPDIKTNVRDLPSQKAVKIIKESVNVEFGLYPFLLIYTGLRRAEALALRRECFDFENNTISITEQAEWLNGIPKIKKTKTGAGVRTIHLLKPLKDVLPKDWKGYLFSEDGGTSPLTSAKYHKLWLNYCKQVGLVEKVETVKSKKGNYVTHWNYLICPHQLRHEFATICFDAELDVLDTMEMMGHASEETTRRIYTHIRESRREKSFGKLDKYVESSY